MARDDGVRRIAGLDVDYDELNGFQDPRSARILDWTAKKEARGFNRLCERLAKRNWVRRVHARGGDRLEALRSYQRGWRDRNRERLNRLERLRRAKKRGARFIVCDECSTKVRATRRKRFCGTKCRNAYHGRIRTALGKRNRGLRNMQLVPAIVAALEGGPRTAAELRAALPSVKPGSLATKLCTMVQAGELSSHGPKKGRLYALPEAAR